jgi:hypothetical protein
VRPVDLCQQPHIAAGVPGGKPSPAIRHGLDDAIALVLTDEPRHLRQAQTGDFAEIGAHRSALFLGFARVLLRHQHLLNERIAIGSALPGKLDCKTAPEELLNLLLGETFCVVHANLHPAAEGSAFSHFQDHLVLESSPVSGSSCIGQFYATTWLSLLVN